MSAADVLRVYVMYYALFKRGLSVKRSLLLSALPKEDVFGVFTTIRRHHVLQEYPKDIHGCIGYWDPAFQVLSTESLLSHLLEVAYDATWNDTRKDAFPPLDTDPYTKVEMDFMMRPLYRIDPMNGFISELHRPFDNNVFGIILQTKGATSAIRGGSRRTRGKGRTKRKAKGWSRDKQSGGKRATYLPHVFENMSWDELLESIKGKAGITGESFELYAYRIQQITTSFSDFFKGKTCELFRSLSISSVAHWLFSVMKVDTPFLFPYSGSAQDELTWNTTEQVRGIALLGDMYTYLNRYPRIATIKQKEQLYRTLRTLLQHLDEYSSQALSFLGHLFAPLSVNPVPFCKKLEKDITEAEEEFERPELLIGLQRAGCEISPRMVQTLSFGPKDSIFTMNWRIQALVRMGRTPSPTLISTLLSRIKGMIASGLNSIETNQVAVAFEAVCFAASSRSVKHEEIVQTLFPLFTKLEQRRTGKDGKFYAFLDGNFRVDITTHVLNGWCALPA